MPLPALIPFHESRAKIRVLSAANGIGKSTAGAADLVAMATGHHRWRKQDIETHLAFWAVPLDRDKTGLVMWQKLRELMPPGFRYNKAEQTFYLPRPYNSRIQIIQQAAGRTQFQAARVRAVWIDEECPASQGGDGIFSEILARKEPGVDLDITYTFTPTNGLDWSYRKLCDENAEDRLKNVEVFYATIDDAAISCGGFYSDEEIEEIKKKYPVHERQARLTGHASLLGGALYFNRHALNRLRGLLPTGERVRLQKGHLSALSPVEDDLSDLQIFQRPVSGRQYIIGSDPGGGVGRDSSVAIVFDRATLKCCAIFSSNRVDPDFFGAETLRLLGLYYNSALLVVESNNHGGTVLSQLKGGLYPNLFVRRDWSKYDGRMVPEYGFRTDTRTRPRIFDALARTLREEAWSNVPQQLLSEMETIIQNDDGKVEAQIGYFDDAVMAAGIALAVNYEDPPPIYPNKDQYRIRVTGVSENSPSWMAA